MGLASDIVFVQISFWNCIFGFMSHPCRCCVLIAQNNKIKTKQNRTRHLSCKLVKSMMREVESPVFLRPAFTDLSQGNTDVDFNPASHCAWDCFLHPQPVFQSAKYLSVQNMFACQEFSLLFLSLRKIPLRFIFFFKKISEF